MMRAFLLLLLLAGPTQAFNALGHKVVADIAWQELSPAARQGIVNVLRRHPQFDDDFAKQGDIGDDQWVFQHAATWPDIARGTPRDMPTWHYVNYPLFVGGERPAAFNLDTEPDGKAQQWNVMQAIAYCRKVIGSQAPPSQQALAYSWLFHLVGDLHQPCHSTALVCERFPAGDRGGNSIPLRQGDNLHSLWDNLLGREHRPNDVKREVAELQAVASLWKVDTTDDVASWIDESRNLAKEFAYSPEVLEAVNRPGELAPINLPRAYLEGAGEHARRRVVQAGLRLASLLAEDPAPVLTPRAKQVARPMALAPPPAKKPSAPPSSDHWLNLSGNVRHNQSCRWYQNTKRGRACLADEGRACGQCGG